MSVEVPTSRMLAGKRRRKYALRQRIQSNSGRLEFVSPSKTDFEVLFESGGVDGSPTHLYFFSRDPHVGILFIFILNSIMIPMNVDSKHAHYENDRLSPAERASEHSPQSLLSFAIGLQSTNLGHGCRRTVPDLLWSQRLLSCPRSPDNGAFSIKFFAKSQLFRYIIIVRLVHSRQQCTNCSR